MDLNGSNRISEAGLRNVPPRSREEIVSSIFAISIGIFDIYLLMLYKSMFGYLVNYLVALLCLMLLFVGLMLWGYLSVEYLIKDEKLIIFQSLGREEVPFTDLFEFSRAKLGLLRQFLWGLIPTFTVRDGLMLELKGSRKLFISPSRPEEFSEVLEQFIEGTSQRIEHVEEPETGTNSK